MHLSFLQYFPPAQPDGIPIHNVSIEVVKTNDSDILNSTILFTIIPAACETAVPLIGAALANREDMIGRQCMAQLGARVEPT